MVIVHEYKRFQLTARSFPVLFGHPLTAKLTAIMHAIRHNRNPSVLIENVLELIVTENDESNRNAERIILQLDFVVISWQDGFQHPKF